MVDNLIVAITNWKRRKKFSQHLENHSIDVYLESHFRNALTSFQKPVTMDDFLSLFVSSTKIWISI